MLLNNAVHKPQELKSTVKPNSQRARKIKLCERLPTLAEPEHIVCNADKIARKLPVGSVDLVVTSPPYWQKRDYGHADQLGAEATPQKFIDALMGVLESWRPLLKPSSSVFINLGDSVRDGCFVGIPTLFETAATQAGWKLISRILWAKKNGMPDPHGRLPQRHEFIFQLALNSAPFVDTFSYGQQFCLSEGNVWHIELRPTKNSHLAPFPEELPRRAILLACPERVCRDCSQPLQRLTQRGLTLNPERPQAQRALKLWEESGLNGEHLKAIRATGICDAGKSLRFQSGARKNSADVTRLAQEAKDVLGGYFREFTFALIEQTGWQSCACGSQSYISGLVLDPFAGTGTTLRAATALGRRSVGADLLPIKSF